VRFIRDNLEFCAKGLQIGLKQLVQSTWLGGKFCSIKKQIRLQFRIKFIEKAYCLRLKIVIVWWFLLLLVYSDNCGRFFGNKRFHLFHFAMNVV